MKPLRVRSASIVVALSAVRWFKCSVKSQCTTYHCQSKPKSLLGWSRSRGPSTTPKRWLEQGFGSSLLDLDLQRWLCSTSARRTDATPIPVYRPQLGSASRANVTQGSDWARCDEQNNKHHLDDFPQSCSNEQSLLPTFEREEQFEDDGPMESRSDLVIHASFDRQRGKLLRLK